MSESINTNQRIKILVDMLLEGNVAGFARSINVAQQRFDRLLKPNKKTEKYPDVKTDVSEAILQVYPDVRRAWLLAGEEPMMLNQVHDPPYTFNGDGLPYYKIDFIDEFDLIHAADVTQVDYYIDIKAFSHADFWCDAYGDMVAMKKIHDKKNDILYGETYGIATKGFRTIKRVVQGKNERYIKLISTNPHSEYTEQEILLSKVEHIFHVLCCIKKM